MTLLAAKRQNNKAAKHQSNKTAKQQNIRWIARIRSLATFNLQPATFNLFLEEVTNDVQSEEG